METEETGLEPSAGSASPLAVEDADRPLDERRRFPRRSVRGTSSLVIGGTTHSAELVNVSYGGMLILLSRAEIGLGSEVATILVHPESNAEISIESRVVNRTRCDDDRMAVGVQFQYPFHRIDEVMGFIDDLQGLAPADKMTRLAGSLADSPLEDVIGTVAGASGEGTLRIFRGGEEGILIHRDGAILHAATGLVSGMKAVSRMLLWRDGGFVYQAAIGPFETSDEPLPLESALLSAMVHLDEAMRAGCDRFDPDDTFHLDEDLMEQLAPELDDLYKEIAEHVRMDFPLGAILDILPQDDGSIYKALVELLESGAVRAQQPAS